MAAEFARKHANTVVTGLASAAPLLLASQHSGGGAGMETVGLAGLAVGAKFLESSGPLSQNRNLHKEIVDLEREQHKEAQHLQKQQHDAEQKLQRTQHLQDATKDLQESSKEADRDLMDARTERFQNLMMVSSLFLSGCFTLAVEGTLPEDPGTVFGGRCALVDVYYFLLAISIGLNWVTIMCSLRITSRISDYMQKVTHKQQDLLQNLRWTALQQAHESLEHGTFGSSTEFTKSLRKIPIIKMSESLHRSRRVASFTRWYACKCRLLEFTTMRTFEAGVSFMFMTVMFYIIAHLDRGEDEEVQSSQAMILFVSITGALMGVSFVLPELLGGDVAYAFVYDGICGIGKWMRKARRGLDVEELDEKEIVVKAKQLFDAMDANHDGNLTVEEIVLAVHNTRYSPHNLELRKLREYAYTLGLTRAYHMPHLDKSEDRERATEHGKQIAELLQDPAIGELLQDCLLNALYKLPRKNYLQKGEKRFDDDEAKKMDEDEDENEYGIHRHGQIDIEMWKRILGDALF